MTSKKYLGVDIGGTKVHMGVVQAGELLHEVRFDTSATAPQEQILAELAQQLAPLVAADVAGIGIGVPGLVDEENGIVHNVQNIPSWREVPLKQYLTQCFGKPVYLTNDANAFAVGEKMYGQGQPYANLVGLALGTGLGAGIIINHQLYAGTPSSAGEFGCIPYLYKTVEDYCSGKFFTQRTGRGRSGTRWPGRATRRRWPLLSSLAAIWAGPFTLSCTRFHRRPFFGAAQFAGASAISKPAYTRAWQRSRSNS